MEHSGFDPPKVTARYSVYVHEHEKARRRVASNLGGTVAFAVVSRLNKIAYADRHCISVGRRYRVVKEEAL